MEPVGFQFTFSTVSPQSLMIRVLHFVQHLQFAKHFHQKGKGNREV